MLDQWNDKSWTRHNFEDMKDIDTYFKIKNNKKWFNMKHCHSTKKKYIKPLQEAMLLYFKSHWKCFSHACLPIA